MYWDTHCHLNHPDVEQRAAEVASQALAAGVKRLIVVGYDLASSKLAVEQAGLLPGVSAAVGVHPHDAKSWMESQASLVELLGLPSIVAYGEIGLDFYRDLSPRSDQFDCLRDQLKIADEMNLPVIFHCRDAYDELLGLLETEGPPKCGGVMHCWAGTIEHAQRTLDLGLHLGFGGVITYKNADSVREAGRLAPLDRILSETDAPYLAPVPFRGKPNLPEYIPIIVNRIADERGEALEVVAAALRVNAERLFL